MNKIYTLLIILVLGCVSCGDFLLKTRAAPPTFSGEPVLPKKKTTYESKWFIFGDLGGTRTHGPLIKSQLLYQLSYEVFLVASGFNRFAGANMQQYFLICKKIIL